MPRVAQNPQKQQSGFVPWAKKWGPAIGVGAGMAGGLFLAHRVMKQQAVRSAARAAARRVEEAAWKAEERRAAERVAADTRAWQAQQAAGRAEAGRGAATFGADFADKVRGAQRAHAKYRQTAQEADEFFRGFDPEAWKAWQRDWGAFRAQARGGFGAASQSKMPVDKAFETVGAARGMDPAAVRKAYQASAFKHHPDRGGDVAKMQEVNEAFDVLRKAKLAAARKLASVDRNFEQKLAELGPSMDAYLQGLELQKLAQEVMLDGEAKKKGVTEGEVDSEQLAMGIEIEMEHTADREAAKKICLDHLSEIPDYYTRLKAMEAKVEGTKEGQDAGAPASVADATENLERESERLQALEALRRAGKNVWEYGTGPGVNKATEPLLRAADLPNPFPM